MSTPSGSNAAIGGKTKRKENGEKIPNRLVLCFDGTGNKFSGTSGDTNIVKLYQMCDRSAKGQYHYYQRMQSMPFMFVLPQGLFANGK
jgi:uncharacterized protein (DUF2235 family)